MISNVGKALAHNSSDNRADFFPCSPRLCLGGRKKAGGEFNPRAGVCRCSDIYMALLAQGCQLSERVIMKINCTKAI